MEHKYLAFDIETAKIISGESFDIQRHRPLGITCAATWCADEPAAETFCSKNADGTIASQMTTEDLTALVEHLKAKVASGYTILTHNGLSFDFDILAEESGQINDCKELASNHVDIMFHFFCGKGFPIGLNAAAQAIDISKPENVSGGVAPQLWEKGDHQTVLDYVAQDCRLTLDVAEASNKTNCISWITKKGKKSSFDLPQGWLTVKDALELPLPDTSWMDNPSSRSKFSEWIEDNS